MLHGLGAMVPDGGVVTYSGQWPHTLSRNAASILQQVIAALAQDGLQVTDHQSDASFLSTEVAGKPYNVKLKVRVMNGMGFGDPSDVASIVDHEFYGASGTMPLNSGIIAVEIPGAGPPLLPADQATLPQAPTDWGKWLQNNFTTIALLAAGVVIAPVLLKKLL